MSVKRVASNHIMIHYRVYRLQLRANLLYTKLDFSIIPFAIPVTNCSMLHRIAQPSVDLARDYYGLITAETFIIKRLIY